jgi:hypothetical protein
MFGFLLPARGEREMGLYERLLQEVAELPEDPNQKRNERMSAYLRSLRRSVPEGGGYVTKEELEEEQERYLREVRSLCSLLVNGAGSLGGKYWLGCLKRKYPTEYNILETIKMFEER